MWLFLALGPATYLVLGLHVLLDRDNARHIAHTIVSQSKISIAKNCIQWNLSVVVTLGWGTTLWPL